MPDERTEVAIVGGGPSGLALALELGLHGITSTVVEPRRIVLDGRPRAKTTSARTMELFRRLGVAEEIRSAAPLAPEWSDRITFCATVTGPEVTHFDHALGLHLGSSDLVAEPGQQVTQPTIERVLRGRLTQSATSQLLLGWRGTAIEELDDRVRVTIEDERGGKRTIEADHVVGADGARSVVRRHLGVRYEGAEAGRPNVNITFRSRRLAAAIPHPPSVHYWVLNPASPGVVGPLDLDGTWWAISTGTASIDDDAHAERLIRDLIGPDVDVDVEILATDPWQARMLLASSYGRGRIHIAGDAAHQNPPWGGHGFNTGVGDAINLGWKIAAVQRGWAPQALLDSYEAERRPVARLTIDVAATNTAALAVDLSDPALMDSGPDFDRARDRAAEVIQRSKDAEFHSLGLVLGAGYTPEARRQASTLDDYRPGVAPGARLPHALTATGESLFDLLGPDLTVIGEREHADPLLQAAGARGIPVVHVGPQPHLSEQLVLVRPDQVIAWAGSAGEPMDPVLDAAVTGFGPVLD